MIMKNREYINSFKSEEFLKFIMFKHSGSLLDFILDDFCGRCCEYLHEGECSSNDCMFEKDEEIVEKWLDAEYISEYKRIGNDGFMEFIVRDNVCDDGISKDNEWCILFKGKLYSDRFDSEYEADDDVEVYVSDGIGEVEDFEVRQMTDNEMKAYDNIYGEVE